MKKLLFSLAFVFALASTADADPYVGFGVYGVFLEDSEFDDGFDTGEFSFDTGFGVAGMVGTRFPSDARAEVEVAYRQNDMDDITIDELGSGRIDDGEVSSLSVLVNAYQDFGAPGAVRPYVGGGLGLANVNAELLGEDDDDLVFAYQLGAGLGFDLGGLKTDVGYRFFGTSNPEFDGVETEYHSHNLFVGLRF